MICAALDYSAEEGGDHDVPAAVSAFDLDGALGDFVSVGCAAVGAGQGVVFQKLFSLSQSVIVVSEK